MDTQIAKEQEESAKLKDPVFVIFWFLKTPRRIEALGSDHPGTGCSAFLSMIDTMQPLPIPWCRR